jgi:hypothetical protein
MVTVLIASMMMGPLAAANSDVPARRVDLLAKGINLSHWWAQSPDGGYTMDRLERTMREEDFQQIKRDGFRHVRLTLEPRALWDLQTPVKLDPQKVTLLRRNLKWIVDAKLGVIVDVHPEDSLKETLRIQTGADAFVAFWEELAKVIRTYDSDYVFAEFLNEPVIPHEVWDPVQRRLVASVRPLLPDTTFIVSGGKWSGLEDFLKLEPYPDSNVVYNFHCYEPFAFSHQGATWGWDMSRHFKGLPYPSTPEAVAKILPKIENEEARGHVQAYGAARWDHAKLERLVKQAGDWGRKHGVPVTCNEFGCYRLAPEPDRIRHLTDLRKALEAHRIGWCMWDYAGGFSAYSGSPGNRDPDEKVLSALGLR